MVRVDMTAQQARAAATLLREAVCSLEEMPRYDTLESLVLAVRALQQAAEEPEVAARPAAQKKPRAAAPREPESADEGGVTTPSPASAAAQLKRRTLERLEAYATGTRLGATGRVAAAAKLPNETVARMLERERLPVEQWRRVAAALDKLETKETENNG